MRRIIITLLFSCLGLGVHAQELDSLTRVKLSDKLEEYFDAIKTLDLEAQKVEADFIIDAATDSLLRQFVAVKTYSHFLNSPVMGAEAVAIHVLDKWFLEGTVKMYDETDLLNARIFADFNRQSLLGEKAPQLTILTPENEAATLYASPAERYSILYIYDTDCAKCKLESMRLNKAFSEKSYPVDFHALYAGDNKDKWEQYREVNFKFNEITVRHFWDPEVDSDFQRKYGVLQTPRMFLIAPDGEIVGRGLDTSALIQLLERELSVPEMHYGNPDSEQLFDKLLGAHPSAVEIHDVADMLADATLGEGNVMMFKQLIGDYLYYLAPKTKQAYRYGLNWHINKYILGRPDIWNTEDDSLKVVGFAQIMQDLITKTPTGKKVPSIKVEGTLLSGGKEKVKKMKLSKMKGFDNIIIFHTTGCPVCAAEIEEARRLVEAFDRINVFLVNVDEVMASDPSKATELFDAFDLSVLPQIVWTDENNIVRSCYNSLIDGNFMEVYPLMGRVY